MDLDSQEIENPEEQELQQEDGEQKGKLDLTRHHKRAKRTSKKCAGFVRAVATTKEPVRVSSALLPQIRAYEERLLEMESQLNPQQNH